MEQPFLKYSKDLDDTIGNAIEKDLQVRVSAVERIPEGEFNYSYKISTDKGIVLARIFRQSNSPEDRKLRWIEDRLAEHNIPHAKTLFYTRAQTSFPNGYMVQEFVEGMSGSKAILEGHTGFEEFFNQYVVILQKIHSISVLKSEELPRWAVVSQTFYEAGSAKYKKIRERLSPRTDIKDSVHQAVFEKVQELKEYYGPYKPVLLHGDPGADNVLLRKDGEMVLIDWDNAAVGSWIEEYAWMTFRGAYLWQYKTDNERNEMIERSFRHYYKGVNFDDPDSKAIVNILHILTAYGALATAYFQHQDLELYQKAKKKLSEHLQRRIS